MSRLIRFFTKILDICKLVPMLPVVVIAAIPLALLGDWRPWGNAMAIPVLGNPGFGVRPVVKPTQQRHTVLSGNR